MAQKAKQEGEGPYAFGKKQKQKQKLCFFFFFFVYLLALLLLLPMGMGMAMAEEEKNGVADFEEDVSAEEVGRRVALGIPTAMFTFGDSLVDVGMNNHLPDSIAKANFLPNGIDFLVHGRPTGRFCNGRIVADFVAAHWGIQPPLAYTDPSMNDTTNFLLGANFASGGSGILNDTGLIFVQYYSLNNQVELFSTYAKRLREMVGEQVATQILNNAFYSINIGSNDFLSNYFLSPVRKLQYSMPDYQTFLISQLRRQLKNIYNDGARKMVVAGVGPFGCMPSIIGARFFLDRTGQCIQSYQQVAMNFNGQIVSMLQELRQELPDATILYSNGFSIAMDIMQNASKYGLKNLNSACCGRGTRYKGIIPCRPSMKICDDRDSYFFWDPFHPTEAVNKIIAQRALFGSLSDIDPINVSQLFSFTTQA